MFRNIIKKFALSLVADDIKAMINEAVQSAVDNIDLDDLASTVAESIEVDTDEIARHIDTDRIAESVAENIDTDQIASSVAENIDVDSVADSVADNIDMEAIAENINLKDLAEALIKVRGTNRRIRLKKAGR
jgi:predicted regulator of amino acid metabolism with ACT domain